MAGTTASSDTIWHGALLGQRAHDWVAQVAGSGATYTTMQQNDNAAIAALTAASTRACSTASGSRCCTPRGRSIGRIPSRPPTTRCSRIPARGASSLDNLVTAGAPLVADIVADWSAWQSGVPQ